MELQDKMPSEISFRRHLFSSRFNSSVRRLHRSGVCGSSLEIAARS
ncbi:hypothetical protein NEICINOT_03168 [Neisseria cinerea ATCC 14685]|uniref:Uncharacterized protein n=1 Tax=Neisseria cinerea ATCC 14685 TaxID=546262 RepID=D0W0K2_NEICI|nr:hypothetical protein NEICINOT_03168 [Neisseria cinerea ATCC 14685]